LKAFAVFFGAGLIMVSVIAFLTVTNIALGYGLAIYIHRHYGTLVVTRSRPPQSEVSAPIGKSEVEDIADEVVELANEMHATIEPAPVLEAAAKQVVPIEAPAETGEPVKASAVDEENVLAGIEEFRSQLAKMSSTDASTEVSESDLVEAAN
jgi:hypothetical protein